MYTSIKTKEETSKKLNKLKYQLGLKSQDAVIDALLKLVKKYKLVLELKEVQNEAKK